MSILKFIYKLLGIKLYKYQRELYTKNAVGKIGMWQRRENGNVTPAIYHDIDKSDKDKYTAMRILNYLQNEIEFVKDWDQYGVLDHWPTSSEILNSMKDDCDGFAVAVWAYLRRYRIDFKNIGMVYVSGDPAHMITCWHENGDPNDFWVLDNGYMSDRMVKASKLFPFKRNGVEMEPKYGFNHLTWWRYNRIAKF